MRIANFRCLFCFLVATMEKGIRDLLLVLSKSVSTGIDALLGQSVQSPCVLFTLFPFGVCVML